MKDLYRKASWEFDNKIVSIMGTDAFPEFSVLLESFRLICGRRAEGVSIDWLKSLVVANLSLGYALTFGSTKTQRRVCCSYIQELIKEAI